MAKKKGFIAYLVAAGFILLLLMELLAIFSPAIRGRGGPGFRLTVYTPAAYRAQAEEIAKAVAEALGDGYRVELLGNSSIAALALVVGDRKGEPLLVVFTVPQLAENRTQLSEYARLLAGFAERVAAQLPSNVTMVYFGANQSIYVPRNVTAVDNVIRSLFQHAEQAARQRGGHGLS